MKRVVWMIVAACSSHEQVATKGSGGASVAAPAEAAVTHAQLAWKPLEIEHQPVVELRPQPHMVDGKLAWIGGTATTSTGSYDLRWTLDKLEATPGRGRPSLPDGTWLTDVHSEGEKFVLSLGTPDGHFDAFETADEPIEVIAQFGDPTSRVLVFREGVRWRFAHAATARLQWKIDELPIQGANVASAVDNNGRNLALAWNAGDQGTWLHVNVDEVAARPAKLAGKITSTCANEELWVTTDKDKLQRLPFDEPMDSGPSPTLVACNASAAVVKLGDGTAKLCARRCERDLHYHGMANKMLCAIKCTPTIVPASQPTLQALIGNDLIAIEQQDNLLAITSRGKRVEYDQGGVIQRMQLIDFDGTPVLVAFGRESLDPARWTVIPSAAPPGGDEQLDGL